MKRMILMAAVLLLIASNAFAAFTYSIDSFRWNSNKDFQRNGNFYLWADGVEDRLEGTTAIDFLKLASTDTEPGTAEGLIYYDTSEHTLKQRTNAAWVALGSATFTGGAISGATTFDDGVGASPSVTFTDATDETAVFSKADAGFLTVTTVAGDGLGVLVGNFSIGNGTPDVTLNGEDAYVEGTLEVDGAARFDGAVSATSTLTATGAIAANGGIAGDGGDTIGGFKRSVTIDTNNETLTTADSGEVFTNYGDSDDQVYTLPAAAAGLEYTFVVMTAQQLRVTPVGDDVIYINATAASAAEYWWADAVGESVTIIAVDATNWIAVNHIGTWTQQTP